MILQSYHSLLQGLSLNYTIYYNQFIVINLVKVLHKNEDGVLLEAVAGVAVATTPNAAAKDTYFMILYSVYIHEFFSVTLLKIFRFNFEFHLALFCIRSLSIC